MWGWKFSAMAAAIKHLCSLMLVSLKHVEGMPMDERILAREYVDYYFQRLLTRLKCRSCPTLCMILFFNGTFLLNLNPWINPWHQLWQLYEMHTTWWTIWKERPFRFFKAARFMNSSPRLAIWPTLLEMHFSNFSMTLASNYQDYLMIDFISCNFINFQ